MFELFQAMLWPIMAAFLLPPALLYFGCNLLDRRNPFTALALPQIALLGPAVAALLSLSPSAAFPCSVALTLFGGIALSLAFPRSNARRDLFAGALFLVAALTTTFLLQRQSEDIEQVKQTLLGDFLLVNKAVVLRMFAFGASFAVLAAILMRVIRNRRSAEIAFYAVFAIFVSKFVEVGGVVLTFFYTLAPALWALRLAKTTISRLLIGSGMAAAATILTTFLAYRFELPSIPLIALISGIATLPIIAFPANGSKHSDYPTDRA